MVSWAAGGGTVSQAADPAHPEDLLLVADRPGNLTVSVRLREGLAERRETKAITAVANPAAAIPAIASRLLLQEWPGITVAVLVVGFAAALVAVGSLPVGDFIALVAPMTAVLAVAVLFQSVPFLLERFHIDYQALAGVSLMAGVLCGSRGLGGRLQDIYRALRFGRAETRRARRPAPLPTSASVLSRSTASVLAGTVTQRAA